MINVLIGMGSIIMDDCIGREQQIYRQPELFLQKVTHVPSGSILQGICRQEIK